MEDELDVKPLNPEVYEFEKARRKYVGARVRKHLGMVWGASFALLTVGDTALRYFRECLGKDFGSVFCLCAVCVRFRSRT